MKVVLLQLATVFTTSPSWDEISLAAGFLKAMADEDATLRGSVAIKILERCRTTCEEDEDKIVKRILLEEPDVVGFSLYCWNLMPSLSVAGKLKQEKPAIRIVVGGAEVDPDNVHLERASDIDIMCMGEGEVTFVELLRYLAHGTPSIEEIKGISYREGDTVHTNPCREPLKDLDSIPSPYRLGYIEPTDDFMWILVGRGCPNKCKFCCEWIARDGKTSYRSTDNILQDVQIAKQAGVKVVKLEIPTFNTHRNKMKEICEALREVNEDNSLAFTVELRADYVDEGAARMLGLANIKWVELGLETIHPSTLDNIGRHNDLDRFLKGLSLLHEEGIHCSVNLLLGLPGDTLDMLKEMFDYLRENKVDQIAAVHANIVSIAPGTALRRQAKEYGIEYDVYPPYWVRKTNSIDARGLREAMFLFDRAFPD